MKLVEAPIGKAILGFALPIFVGMFFNATFAVTDTYWLSTFHPDALNAIGFVAPVAMTIMHFGTGIDVGTMATVAPIIGSGNREQARTLVMHTVLLAVLLSAVIAVVGLSTIDVVFSALGATEATMPMIRDYMEIYFAGIFFNVVGIVLGGALRSSGNSKDPGMWLTFAAMLNLVLDPLMIFGFGPVEGMGMRGAALASLGSRMVYFFAVLYILSHRAQLFSVREFRFEGIAASWRKNLAVTAPATLNNLLAPLTAIVTTGIMATHGEAAVGAFNAGDKVQVMGFIFVLTLGIAMGPFVGQNLGAGRLDRVRGGLSFAWRGCLAVGAVFLLAVLLGRDTFASMFSDDPQVTSLISTFLLIVGLSFSLQGMVMVGSLALNTLGRPVLATAISFVRTVVVYTPLAYALDRFVGVTGAFYAMAITNVAFGLLTVWLVTRVVQELEAERPAGSAVVSDPSSPPSAA